MNLLAINTAGTDTQLALIKDNLEYLKTAGFSRHSVTLFPLLDELLSNCALNV